MSHTHMHDVDGVPRLCTWFYFCCVFSSRDKPFLVLVVVICGFMSYRHRLGNCWLDTQGRLKGMIDRRRCPARAICWRGIRARGPSTSPTWKPWRRWERFTRWTTPCTAGTSSNLGRTDCRPVWTNIAADELKKVLEGGGGGGRHPFRWREPLHLIFFFFLEESTAPHRRLRYVGSKSASFGFERASLR